MFRCRNCGSTQIPETFASLGPMPLANALVSKDDLNKPGIHYPLHAVVCVECLLVQLPASVDSQTLFPEDYPFRSGLSKEWIEHCDKFAAWAVQEFRVRNVLELGSNDGLGLDSFRRRGVRVLGVDPGKVAAQESIINLGIPTFSEFWTSNLAEGLRDGGYQVDLVIGRNVLAHVPDLDDFIGGILKVVHTDSVVMFEVPYVLSMMTEGHWDQIYHEHHCYFSLKSIENTLSSRGLYVYDAELIPTHGGSIRVYARWSAVESTSRYNDIFKMESEIHTMEPYLGFKGFLRPDRYRFWETLSRHHQNYVIGYGSSAKAVTFLNYCGVGPEEIRCIMDTTPVKQGKYTPGAHIPIIAPKGNKSSTTVINFCWNWKSASEAHIRELFPKAQIVYPFHNGPDLKVAA